MRSNQRVDWDKLLSQYPPPTLDFDTAKELEAAEFFLTEFKDLVLNPEEVTANHTQRDETRTEMKLCTTTILRKPKDYSTQKATPVKILRKTVTQKTSASQKTNSIRKDDGPQLLFHGGPITNQNKVQQNRQDGSKITRTARVGILRKTITYQSK